MEGKRPKRPRIGLICSSENYAESRQKCKERRENYLTIEHNKNAHIVEEISAKTIISENTIVKSRLKPFIKVFGELMLITHDEVEKLPSNVTVIWQS